MQSLASSLLPCVTSNNLKITSGFLKWLTAPENQNLQSRSTVSFHDGEAATWASPQQQQESVHTRLEPTRSVEPEAHLHLPTGLSLGLCAPWKMHTSTFCQRQALGQEQGSPTPPSAHVDAVPRFKNSL